MEKTTFIKLLSLGALTGNILFMCWVTYNGVNEGFQGTLPEKVSYVLLMGLLAVNTFLHSKKKSAITYIFFFGDYSIVQ